MRDVLQMPGILKIAYKLLINDRAKFTALLVGITFAVFRMIEMTSLFSGILSRSLATVLNIGASIWVMDPAIQTVANTIPLPDYVLDEVRSIPRSSPLYRFILAVRCSSCATAPTSRPMSSALMIPACSEGRGICIDGNIQNIFAENAFIAMGYLEFINLKILKIGTPAPPLGISHRGYECRKSKDLCSCRWN